MKYYVKEGQKIQIAYDKPELKAGDEFVKTKDNEAQIKGLLEMGVIYAFDETKLEKKSEESKIEKPVKTKKETKTEEK